METSDSECFESADEDFFSSDEIDRDNEKSKHITTEVEKLQYLNINEGHEKSNKVEESGNDIQCQEQCVKDEMMCNEKIGKTCRSKEVEEAIHVEKQSTESMLDNENRNLPEKHSIKCKPNLHDKGTSINSLEGRIDISLPKQEQIHICDNKNENTEDREGNYDHNTSDKLEHKYIKPSMERVQEAEKKTIENNIKNEDTVSLETSKVDTNMWLEAESESNMWEDDGWDIDNEDVENEVCCTQNESLNSNHVEHTKARSTSEIKQADIKTLDGHLNPSELTSNTKQLNNESRHLEEEKQDLENMWDNDDWEPLEAINDQPEHQKMQQKSEKSGSLTTDAWSSWGSWGVSSILTTATTLTNHVSQGLNTIVDTSLGIPDPQELARLHKREEEELNAEIGKNEQETANNTGTLGFGLGNLVSGVSNITKFVEETGNKVISGGLDTLETIGKKTMEVLQEGDPGLKKKRQFLKLEQEKPILSQVLREAKEKSEQENQSYQQKHLAKKKNYEILFDDHHGLVHLEALEMLSKQCDIKLKTLTETCDDEKALMDLQETLEQVKELCELPDEDEEEQSTMEEVKEKLQSAVKDLNINISYDKLLSTWEETETWLNNVNLNVSDENELHQQAIEMLAQLTAIAVEQFHKAGELLLIKEHHSTADEADSLVQLTTTLTSLIGIVAGKFSEKLNLKALEKSSKENINDLITNVFFEAANSSSYIQDAFQLLIPVLQVGAV
nr:unnamed protein product [Callosobruchus chinensis]